jgi:hypothetical protein
MSTRLEGPVAKFSAWRTAMVERIDEFRTWMDAYCPADIEQTLRIYDLVEALRNDSIRITVVGDGAPGKAALVNSLLFADVSGGLLPGGAGSEYLCATEVFHVGDERPFVRMLPIETRKRRDSFAALKRNPVDWVQMRLDPNSPESMSEMATTLTESKEVSTEEARELGIDVPEGTTTLRVPAWRYALINFPHPAMQSGLTVYYTPDLAMLKSDPEIALRMISSAQSLLFVLGGALTPLAHEMWLQYAASSRAQKFVVLDAESIADPKEPALVADVLGLPPANVLPIALQKAFAARMRGDEAAVQATGLTGIEELHGREVIPERQTRLLKTIAAELGPILQTARQAAAAKFIATVKEMQELSSASGKNRERALAMLQHLEVERKNYQKAVSAFNITSSDLRSKGAELVATLHDERIEDILSHDRTFIEGAWTTAGLWKNMQGLFFYFSEQVAKLTNYAAKLKEAVDQIYEYFHANFGLAKQSPPPLILERHTEAMHSLEENTRRFCHDPVNVATYKDFFIKKFYDGLVEEARQIFELTRLDTEQWLRAAFGPLTASIREREVLMVKRVEALRNLRDNLTTVQDRLKQLDQQKRSLKSQSDLLDQLRASLASGGTSPQATTAAAAPAAKADELAIVRTDVNAAAARAASPPAAPAVPAPATNTPPAPAAKADELAVVRTDVNAAASRVASPPAAPAAPAPATKTPPAVATKADELAIVRTDVNATKPGR